MAMTPEEYAAKELHVEGYDVEEPVYAPGSEADPNIQLVLNGGVKPEPVNPEADAETIAMAFEHNFTLPLELRRAELAHLNARTGFWNTLTLAIMAIAGLVK